MMTCAQTLEMLDDLVDETLATDQESRARLHLATCLGCELEARRLQALLAHARALPRERAPVRDLWPVVAGRLSSRGEGRVGLGLFAAAGLLLVVGIAGMAGSVGVLGCLGTPAPLAPSLSVVNGHGHGHGHGPGGSSGNSVGGSANSM